MRVVWSPTARRQVLGAVERISDDWPNAATAWFDGLIERTSLLTDLPTQGRVVPEWGDDSVREILYEPYRVVYELHADRVEILVLSHYRQRFPDEKG
ncbi:MAG: type II toxin-antitoxin system RelE/ParE family toxin [Gemmatimonadetes bacterium]|nr:type II toxin-antitoxin system RelE/ParE family toxin [Gemmatimonadota bacterium]